jgi:polysaccharide biosynthesis protein PslH
MDRRLRRYAREGDLELSKPRHAMRILFTTPVLRHPPDGGPYLRVENSIKALARVADVHLHSRVPLRSIGGDRALSLYEAYAASVHFAPEDTTGQAGSTDNRVSRRRRRRGPNSEQGGYPDLLDLAAEIKPDVIWLGFGNVSYPVLAYIKERSDHKVVVDTDSVWSRFVLRGLPYARNRDERRQIAREGKQKAVEERWGTRLADVTTAVSDVDAAYYTRLARDSRKIHRFSNVIDPAMYQPVPPPAPGLRRPCLYLAGTFWPRSPMDDAARWLIEAVLPLVRRRIPDIHLYVVGTGSREVLADVDGTGLTIAGSVPSVLPYLCHADVALVPLRFESGTRFKILEAGLCGVPVVSTLLGAEGIPAVDQRDLVIADDPFQFASAIVRLLENRAFASRLSDGLRELVRRTFTVSSLADEATQILRYLGSNSD